ncbi:MAG: hypothetical protein AAF310_06165 [Myxococcota bacterium]
MKQIQWEYAALIQSYHLRMGWADSMQTRGMSKLPDLGETAP